MSKFHVGDTVRFTRGTFKGDLATVTEVDVPDELDPDDPNKIQLGVVHGKKFTVHFPESIFEFVSEPSMFEKAMMGLSLESHADEFDDDEVFSEMAVIEKNKNRNVSITVDCESSHGSSIPYFKAYNHQRLSSATMVIRLHYRDDGIEVHTRDPKHCKPWDVDSKDIDDIIYALTRKNKDFPEYSNWQVACFQWNEVNDIFDPGCSIKEYMKGTYDKRYAKISNYIPSTQSMPERWDKTKVGTKRKDE